MIFCRLVLGFREIGRTWPRFIEAHGGRDEAAIGERRPDGRQEIGSEPRLDDIAEPTRVERGPGVVGIFVDREKDEAGRSRERRSWRAASMPSSRCIEMSSTMTSG